MKGKKIMRRRIIYMLTVALAISITTPVFADVFLDQTKNAVDMFNSLNNGQGYYYAHSPANGLNQLTTMSGADQADLSAYAPGLGGDNYLMTFCVEPIVGTAPRQYGKLNYENNRSTTVSGDSLTFGAAYLYAAFATGTLDGYNYGSASYVHNTELKNAIQALIGAIDILYWGSNDFLSDLLVINSDQSYWTQAYDPGRFYEEIGDYSVFVMNNEGEDGSHRQDFLFLVAHESGSAATPEPGTMMICGLAIAGGIPLVLRYRRSRNRNEHEYTTQRH